MKQLTFFFAVLALALPAIAQTPDDPPPALVQALTDNSHAFAAALLHKDVAFLKRTLTGDFEEVTSAGSVENDNEIFDAAANGEFREYRQYNLQVLAIADESALVTYDCIVRRPEGDNGLAPRYQHISELWLRDEGKWLLRFLQATAARPVD